MTKNALYQQVNPMARNSLSGIRQTQQLPRISGQTMLAAGSMIPGIGDAVGLAGDAYTYATDPSSRNIVNYGLTAASLIPGVPSMAGKAKSLGNWGPQTREALEYWVSETGSLKEAVRQLRQSAKTSDPDLNNIADYGDFLEETIRFNRAETPDIGALKQWFKKQGDVHGKTILRILQNEEKAGLVTRK